MKLNLLPLACSLLVCSFLSAQSFTEGADLPGAGSGPAFTVSGPNITIAGQLNTPGDGQDRFQIIVPAGCMITSVTYSMTDNFNIGVNGFFQFGIGNQQSFPPLTGTFTTGPSGPFPVGPGTYDCMIAANIAATDNWSMVFNTSCTTGISGNAIADPISVYPNPASDEIFVTVNLEAAQSGVFEIDNIFGQVVGVYNLKDGENKITISTAELNQGFYFSRTIVNGIPEKTEKVIIQR